LAKAGARARDAGSGLRGALGSGTRMVPPAAHAAPAYDTTVIVITINRTSRASVSGWRWNPTILESTNVSWPAVGAAEVRIIVPEPITTIAERIAGEELGMLG